MPGRLRLFIVLLVGLLSVTPAVAQTGLDLFGDTAPKPAFGDKATVEASANFETVQPGQQVVIAIVLDVVDGYHAQSATPLTDNLIAFRIDSTGDDYTAYEPTYAPGKVKIYPLLSPETQGKVDLYEGRSVHYVPVEIDPDTTVGSTITITGTATYQACDDQSCDPPTTVDWSVALPVVAREVETADQALFADFDPTTWTRLQEATGASQAFNLFGWELDLANFNTLGVLALAFVAGILFNVVPCVLPVLPLKAISFYEASQHRRGRTIVLGLAFGLGVVLVFVALGIMLFSLKLFTWGEPFSNPWFSGIVALVLLVMAAYQFDVITFALPMKVYSLTPRHDTVTGNIAFGGLTAVLSTPCTFGLFAALLSWALAQEAWLAVLGITVVGIGMASPYVLLSAFPESARKIPRSGPVSDVVKKATGFLVLAIAVFFAKVALRPILPGFISGNAYWWLVFVPVAAACVFLIVQGSRATGRIGTAICITLGVGTLIAALIFTGRLASEPFEKFDTARLASIENPIVVKFTADWCLNCKTIEARVFGDSDYVDGLRSDDVTLLKADLSDADAEGWALLEELNPSRSIPFTAVYLPGESRPRTLTGMYSADDLDAALQK